MLTRTDIEKYFTWEKHTALAFLITGVVLLAGAVLCWLFSKQPFWKGAALPALITGFVLISACYPVYKKNDEQRISHVYALDMNPDLLTQKELPRMQAAAAKLKWLRIAEAVLVATGIALLLLYRLQPGKAFWCGLGCSLAIMAAVLLVTDTFAAQRLARYTRQLHTLSQH